MKWVLCKTGFTSPKFVARLRRAKIVGDEFVLAQPSITSVNTRAANRTMYRSLKRIHYTHIIVGNNQMILAAALRCSSVKQDGGKRCWNTNTSTQEMFKYPGQLPDIAALVFGGYQEVTRVAVQPELGAKNIPELGAE